jgi:membrane protease YdiL (CAAX protease family)
MTPVTAWSAWVLAVGLGLFIFLLGSRSFRRYLLAGDRPARPAWPASDLLLVVALAAVGIGVLNVIFLALEGDLEPKLLHRPFIQLLLGIVSLDGVIAAAVVLVVSRHSWSSATALGMKHGRPFRDVYRGVLLYGTAVPALMGVMFAWAVILKSLGQEPKSQPVVQLLSEPQPAVLFVASAALAIGVAPILEEIIFRGFLMNTLVNRVGPVTGIVGSAAFFGALHGWPACVPIFFVGLLLGLVYWKTGSLWVNIGCHAAFNTVSLVGISLLTEQPTNGLQALLCVL